MELTAHTFTLNHPFNLDAYILRNAVLNNDPNSEISRYIDGDYRKRVHYPRIHFSVIDSKPVLVGMKEAMKTADTFANTLKTIIISGQEWVVDSLESVYDKTVFDRTDRMYTYRFLTPWIGLNRQNLVRYKYLYSSERTAFLNKMLTQNIIFLMKEFNYSPRFKIFCRIRLNGLNPAIHPEIRMGYFNGEFQTNVYLPRFLAMGCGISRGFGTIQYIDKQEKNRSDTA